MQSNPDDLLDETDEMSDEEDKKLQAPALGLTVGIVFTILIGALIISSNLNSAFGIMGLLFPIPTLLLYFNGILAVFLGLIQYPAIGCFIGDAYAKGEEALQKTLLMIIGIHVVTWIVAYAIMSVA